MATALSDAIANPTIRSFGSHLLGYKGGSDTWERMRIPDTFTFLNAAAAGSGVEVLAATTSKKGRVLTLDVSFSAAVSFQITKSDGTTVLWQGPKCPADTPCSFVLGNGVLNPTANDAVKLKTSGAANVTGTVAGSIE